MALSNEAILKAISTDRALASSMVFAHRHPQRSPKAHIEVMDIWASADELVLIEAFREFGKSTLAEEFLLLEAAFRNFNYCILIGETYTKACQRLDAIKHEVLRNKALYNLFGDLKGRIWSENRCELKNGVLIEARGWEEELRGFKHLDRRPDRAYLDDIENKERVRDTAAVDASMRKLWMELKPAMDKEEGRIRVTGTPLADDCMINRLRASPDCVAVRYPICLGDIDDPETVSQWEERYPMKWIRKERDKYTRAGMLRAFNQEYMLVAEGTQGKPFLEKHLQFVDLAPRGFHPRHLIVDPARTVNVKTSDRTGRVVVSRIGTRIYVHESGGEYWKPDEIIGCCFDSAKKHELATVAIEKNSLDEWLLQPIRARMLRTGKALPLKALQAPQNMDKIHFILGLQPFFEAGEIILVGGRNAHQTLVAEILNFPSGKRDTLNALAYVLKLFSGEPVYDEFGDENICRDFEPEKGAPLSLGVQCRDGDTAFVLCAWEGRRLVVLADWVSGLSPKDAVPDIANLVRAAYPGRRINAWVPAEAWEQSERGPLLSALRTNGLIPSRGDYAGASRGSLSPLLRTEMHGVRMLRVDENAGNVCNALAGGYAYPAGRGAKLGGEPENGVHRTVMEALEVLSGLTASANNAIPDGVHTSTNPNGTEYFTALPGKRRSA